MSVLISHEFGHLIGAYHTQFSIENTFNEPTNLLDKDIRVPMGRDLVFGTADDITMHFGVDAYDPNEIFVGINDTSRDGWTDQQANRYCNRPCSQSASGSSATRSRRSRACTMV